ncbi:unnamed protein product [Rotaria sp. Silwood1]|nr:unnamed protein product [Rotaria sp. Silwood1]CAF3525006.1 unnamed protein product [Rotaria sp. Silwood1]CAF3544253.1 unnamed protein product [Rotaria sp. Silwood1]CAF3551053.1 unnamed protein product [Rotaria sp. Silwood1]CAF4701157.1 unnamed protein product [Rotaria sp. Silwood1]
MNRLLEFPLNSHPRAGCLSIPNDLNPIGYFDPCKEGLVLKLNDLCQYVEQLPKQNQQTDDEKYITKQKVLS